MQKYVHKIYLKFLASYISIDLALPALIINSSITTLKETIPPICGETSVDGVTSLEDAQQMYNQKEMTIEY